MQEPALSPAALIDELVRLGVERSAIEDWDAEALNAYKTRWLTAMMAEPPQTRE